jgi:hypothetical protein
MVMPQKQKAHISFRLIKSPQRQYTVSKHRSESKGGGCSGDQGVRRAATYYYPSIHGPSERLPVIGAAISRSAVTENLRVSISATSPINCRHEPTSGPLVIVLRYLSSRFKRISMSGDL